MPRVSPRAKIVSSTNPGSASTSGIVAEGRQTDISRCADEIRAQVSESYQAGFRVRGTVPRTLDRSLGTEQVGARSWGGLRIDFVKSPWLVSGPNEERSAQKLNPDWASSSAGIKQKTRTYPVCIFSLITYRS
jgi:hypothetical protein